MIKLHPRPDHICGVINMLATATFVDFYKTDVNEPKIQNYTRAVGRAKAFEPLLIATEDITKDRTKDRPE